MIKKPTIKWLGIVVLIIGGLFVQFKDYFATVELTGKVISVYDGDTIRVKITEIPGISKVRIRDIDCFERESRFSQKQVERQKKRFKLSEEEIYSRGDMSKKFLESLLKVSDGQILLKVNQNNYKDIYGRILASIFADGVDLGIQLLKSGYCFKYKAPKYSKY